MNKYEAFFAAIGRFVLNWADMEMALDLLVVHGLSKAEESEIDKRIPHELGGKIKLARRFAGSIPEWKPHRTRINMILRRIEALSATRHDFIHGAITEHQEGRRTLRVKLARILQPKKPTERPPVTVTTGKVNVTARRVYKLADDLWSLTSGMVRQTEAEPK